MQENRQLLLQLATHPPTGRPRRLGAATRQQGDGGRGAQHLAAAVERGLGARAAPGQDKRAGRTLRGGGSDTRGCSFRRAGARGRRGLGAAWQGAEPKSAS